MPCSNSDRVKEEIKVSNYLLVDNQFLWRQSGTRYAEKFVCELDRYGLGVRVWVGIKHNVRAAVNISGCGIVISQRYCREINQEHVRIFRGTVGPDFLLMDDNARLHRSVEGSAKLQREIFTVCYDLLILPT
ncbi:hypothetical protein TNCV_771681 [Trichonephila clavipes]|nr:hypothetical protein TNCV_771681 [Trichonephila clavipes]